MMNPMEMTVLELLRAVVAGELTPSSMTDTIPMSFVEADFAREMISARVGGRQLNPFGGVHGGFAATALDSLTGCAVRSSMSRDYPPLLHRCVS